MFPAAFIGHGNPMNAIEVNRYTDSWRVLGASMPKPRAALVISAHWFVSVAAMTAMAKPRTIHDFVGFPQELLDVEYPAPGAPEIAAEIANLMMPEEIMLDHESWGLDHGTWSVLRHVFPDADVPVIQLSIDSRQPLDHHFELGSRLATLRERGVFILGSGNVVHNLRRLDWGQPTLGFDWARRFDDSAREVMTGAPQRAVALREHEDFALAAPTPEHFIPMLYIAGLADAAGVNAEVLVDGYAMGSLSMTSYLLGPMAT